MSNSNRIISGLYIIDDLFTRKKKGSKGSKGEGRHTHFHTLSEGIGLTDEGGGLHRQSTNQYSRGRQ